MYRFEYTVRGRRVTLYQQEPDYGGENQPGQRVQITVGADRRIVERAPEESLHEEEDEKSENGRGPSKVLYPVDHALFSDLDAVPQAFDLFQPVNS